MLALCVDDEVLGLEVLRRAMASAQQVTDVATFDYEGEALQWAGRHRPDVTFLDIQMHGTGGLALAQSLRTLHPTLPIIFCTAYESYAIRAMNMHIDASYLMKPIQTEVVVRELDRILAKPPEKLLDVVCFGSFDVFANGRPVNFERSISKELLACLVDRRGARMTIPELYAIVCDSRQNLSRQSVYQALYSLKATLNAVGADEALVSGPGIYSVDTTRISCDYYRLLDGDESAARAFRGEYMAQYSWAEETCGWLVTNLQGKRKRS